MNRIKRILGYLKNKSSRILKSIKEPKKTLASFIYFIYGRDKNKIPFPLLIFVISQFGPQMGLSIYLPDRHAKYITKVNKIKSIFFRGIIPIIILIILSFGASQENDSFLFGFTQNLLADIILILLATYILQEILNKQKKYFVTLSHSSIQEYNTENQVGILLSLHNTGKEVFKKEELYWELYINPRLLNEENIIEINGNIEENNGLLQFWKFHNANSTPLFLDQTMPIARLVFNREHLPIKIYYVLRTNNGNLPKRADITDDFRGMGFPPERYPKWGEFIIRF